MIASNGHVIPTPPPGEPIDQYIARRVGEEIDRQLSARMIDDACPTAARSAACGNSDRKVVTMSDKSTWSKDVEAIRAAAAELRRVAIDSWTVPTVEWLNRKLTR